LKGYPYDPARARQLLSEAGYPEGFPVTLWVQVDRQEDVKAAEVVQQDLAQVGVAVELQTAAFAVYNEATGRRRNVKMTLTGWLQDYPDPSDFLDVLLNGDNRPDIHSNNTSFYSNE